MNWIRWALFNWLAVIFSCLAGRRLEKAEKPLTTGERYIYLLTRFESLNNKEKKELVRLSKKTDDIFFE